VDEARLKALEAQLARMEIVERMWRYSHGVDRHDNDLLESLFWPDCEISYTTVFTGDRAKFLGWANAHHDELYIAHQHHTTAHIIDVDGDTAHGEHYCIVFLQRRDGSFMLSTGRYIQQWERRDGEWRILIREFLPEMSTNLQGGTARLTVTPASLAEMYAAHAHETIAPDTWAPFPPTGPSRTDPHDLSYRRPLGRRASRPADPDLGW
jgi:hypothetical protein